ncbi:hypothetical protein XHV734_2110 [Xanthomonas hortorum pv. vitians]|nr:hypothetical protein XHV734_2110 [Xanthomonas hortorum pv. vitians]
MRRGGNTRAHAARSAPFVRSDGSASELVGRSAQMS